MIKKFFFYIAILFILTKCGFTPIYSEKSNVIKSDYVTILTSNNSLAVKEAFKAIFRNSTEQSNYQLRINITEQDLPIITNSDGTIAKYRIDISTNFILYDTLNKDFVHHIDQLVKTNAGFDPIIIESVGAGQTEIDISNVADITVVVFNPHTGKYVRWHDLRHTTASDYAERGMNPYSLMKLMSESLRIMYWEAVQAFRV